MTHKFVEYTRQGTPSGACLVVCVPKEEETLSTVPPRIFKAALHHAKVSIADSSELDENNVIYLGGKKSVFNCLAYTESYGTLVDPTQYFSSRMN